MDRVAPEKPDILAGLPRIPYQVRDRGRKMSRKDEFFIAYANNSLREDPKNFYKILDALEAFVGDIPIYENRDPRYLPEEFEITASSLLGVFIDQIINLGTDVNQACIKRGEARSTPSLHSFLKDSGHKEDGYFIRGEHSLTAIDVAKYNPDIMINEEAEMVFEAAYGYLDGYCWTEDEDAPGWWLSPCRGQLNLPISELLDFSLFQGPNRLKCYECHQLYFIETLKQIIEGVEYGDVPGLLDFLNFSTEWMIRRVALEKEQIIGEPVWRSPFGDLSKLQHGSNVEFPYKHIFNDFFMSLVSYDLGDFLENPINKKPSRLYLNRCDECGDFFIYERLTKPTPEQPGHFCCKEHRYSYHRPENQPFNAEYKRKRKVEGKATPSYYGPNPEAADKKEKKRK